MEGLHATVSAELVPLLLAIEAKWRASGISGYRIEVADAVDESSKRAASIAAGLPIMLVFNFYPVDVAAAES